MSTYDDYLGVCRRCPFHQRFGNVSVCSADQAEIEEHARSGMCPQNLYPPPGSKLFRGAAGVAKAVTGTGGADAELIAKRIRICSTCSHNKLTLGLAHMCELCGCFTWAKARNLKEKCPAGKW